jgi:hypothetical protein
VQTAGFGGRRGLMGNRQASGGAGAGERAGGACHAPAARLDPGLAEGVPASKRGPCLAEPFPYVLDVRNEAKMQAACSFRGNVQVLAAKHSAQAPKRGQLQVGRPSGIGVGRKRRQTRGRVAAPPSAGRWAPPLAAARIADRSTAGAFHVLGAAFGRRGRRRRRPRAPLDSAAERYPRPPPLLAAGARGAPSPCS